MLDSVSFIFIFGNNMDTTNQQKTKRKKRSTYETNTNKPDPFLENRHFHILNANNGNGKTTYLSSIARHELRNLNLDNCKYSNLICLSGTAFDKFDKYTTFIKYLNSVGKKNTFYYYTGYTSNNNMSSLQIPFRILFEVLNNHLEKNKVYDFKLREDFIANKLAELGFNTIFTVELQKAESTQGKKATEQEVEINLNKNGIREIINFLKNNKLEIKDIIFQKQKNGRKFSIYELSSGEYTFLRALFVLSLAMQKNSLVIYDEPENSLHPEWQSRLIKYIIEIVNKFGNGATILIATHSPLITASFSNKNVKVSEHNTNNPFNFKWIDYKYYGWSANLVLTEQFDLQSARPTEFTDKFNEILEYYIKNDWINLENAINSLERNENFCLSNKDNLNSTYEAIKNELLKHKGHIE